MSETERSAVREAAGAGGGEGVPKVGKRPRERAT